MPRQVKPSPDDEVPDPRFVPVAEAFAGVPGFSLMESRSRAMRGLMFDGSSFGMSSHGRLILKLTDERVRELVDLGVGQPFRPSPARIMRGWIDVTAPSADWLALAREAFDLAVERHRRRR